MDSSPAARIDFLRKRVSALDKGAPTSPVPFRQQLVDLPRIQVPIEFPLYNLKSGRSHRAQSKYIEDNNLPSDYFDDPESTDAQAAQGLILAKLAEEGNLQRDLEEKKQQRPLVLTYDGFIVDGNRRTAAMKEIGGIEQVDAVVLPEDAEAKEIYETELEFQMARDTKAPYNWVDQALHLNRGIFDLGESKEAIARRMNISEDDVDAVVGRLTLVDLYLEWLGTPGRYHRVGEEDVQAFEELWLRTRRNEYKNLSTTHQQAVLGAVFVVIRDGAGYQDVRNVADYTINKIGEITNRIRQEGPPADVIDLLDQQLDLPAPAEADGILDELAESEGEQNPPDGIELVNLVNTPPDDSVVATILTSVAADIREHEKEQKDLSKPLRRVKRALSSLENVQVSAETQRRDEIAQVLKDVVEAAERITAQIDDVGLE